MRMSYVSIPLILLAACATPREQCIDDATRDARIMAALIAETQGNIARGYALEQRQEVRTVSSLCQGRNDDGTDFTFRCDNTETFTTRVPVAIDLNAEAAKLASLQERFTQVDAASDQRVLQCINTFPE